MKNTKEIRKSIVVLVVICLLTSAALAVVNHFTAPVSKANAEARAEQARLDAVPDAASFAPVEAVLPEEVVSAYTALDASGSPMSYLFTVEGKGFGGTIQVLCVIDILGRCKIGDCRCRSARIAEPMRDWHRRFDPYLPHNGCIVRNNDARWPDGKRALHRAVYRAGRLAFRRERHLPRNHHIECLSRLRGNCV